MPSQLLSSLALALALMAAHVAVAPHARAAERVRILLLPMVVHSAENPDYVRRGLSDMMASRLERIPDFEVIRIDERAAATSKLEKAVKRARKEDAEFVLFGSFTRFGTGASLDVHCAAAAESEGDKPLREIFIQSGSIGEVIPDLDDLVGKVARFVIRDFTDRTIVGVGEVPDAPSGRELSDLERRVEALEEALRGLSEQLSEAGPGSPASAEGLDAP